MADKIKLDPKIAAISERAAQSWKRQQDKDASDDKYERVKSSNLNFRTDISNEINQIILNLATVQKLVVYKAARLLANVLADLLANSIPRTPYETGELRESGIATVGLTGRGQVVVASGNKDGTVTYDLRKLTKDKVRGAGLIFGTVKFSRLGEIGGNLGEDVALWAHEVLQPYDSTSHPRAKQQYTGPKYLETPWLENKDEYVAYITEGLSSSITKAGGLARDIDKITQRKGRKGKYVVDEVKLVENRIGMLNWKSIRFGPGK